MHFICDIGTNITQIWQIYYFFCIINIKTVTNNILFSELFFILENAAITRRTSHFRRSFLLFFYPLCAGACISPCPRHSSHFCNTAQRHKPTVRFAESISYCGRRTDPSERGGHCLHGEGCIARACALTALTERRRRATPDIQRFAVAASCVLLTHRTQRRCVTRLISGEFSRLKEILCI